MADFWNSIKDNFDALPTWGKAVIGVAAVGGTLHFLFSPKKGRKTLYKTDYKPNVVYVYQFSRAAVIPSISPYALKLETWLRMADINYENVKIPNWVRSKEGTLPFVELNGAEYDDSAFIIRDLTKLLRKESIEGSLSPEQGAVSRAYQQMVENSTLLSYGFVRYTEYFEKIFDEKIGMALPIPWPWNLLTPTWLIQKQVRNRMYLHGIGRHPREEIINIGLDDLRSIATYLGTKQFFHGDQPTLVDIYLFSTLAQIIYIPIDTPHQKLLNTELRNLVRYCDRIRAKYWPDWEETCKTKAMNTAWKK